MGFIANIRTAILAIQGLDDHLTSAFLRDIGFIEDGFELKGIEENRLVFSVPPQEENDWYSRENPLDLWPSDRKRRVAAEIGAWSRLDYCEPPDMDVGTSIVTESAIRHHIEFHRANTPYLNTAPIAVVHPVYMKTIWRDRTKRIDPDALYRRLKGFYE